MSSGLGSAPGSFELNARLYRMLAKLADRGLVAPPSLAMDLVHDFVLDGHVADVERAFNPAKGSLEAYLGKAFANFAARAIARSRQHRALELDESLLLCEPVDPKQEPPSLSPALANASAAQQELLQEVLYAPQFSLTALARRRGMSAYRLRQEVLDALATVVAHTRKPEGLATADWEVAQLVWREHLPVHEVAARLHKTTHQVRSAQARMLQTLGRGLGAMGFRRGATMEREKLRAPEEVLLNVLRRPDDLDALRELRQRAAEIRHHLEDSNLDVSAHDAELRAHPDWLAKVYDALGDEPEQPVLVEWPYHAELQQVGAAFENVLLPGLPTTLEKLVFVDELTEHAAVAPSVMEQVAAHPSGEIVTRALRQRLARVGLCPMSFLLGADAVADTIDRYLDYGLIASQGAVAVEISEVGFVVGDKLTAAQLTAEIGLRTECPTATSRGLHAWLSQAVRYKPKMLVGFAAAADDGGLLLTRAPRASQRDLFVDWQSSELGLGASAGATGVSRG